RQALLSWGGSATRSSTFSPPDASSSKRRMYAIWRATPRSATKSPKMTGRDFIGQPHYYYWFGPDVDRALAIWRSRGRGVATQQKAEQRGREDAGTEAEPRE